ncbi:zinc finger BED domain-containing protein 4-like [Clavelina lepadiformis]|uniref:zinc finger BED domain-containing protein 4-like n=1 Tax=Clavelina lepadiformis TaxID=159417 RepID=UPI0040438816
MHKTDEEINEDNEKQLDPDHEQEMSEEGADLHALLTYLPERVSCFAHTQQFCIKDCLQHSEFAKSYDGKQLGKVAKIVNSVRKSVNATSYLQRKKITLRAQNVTRLNSQLVMLQSVLNDHEEVNAALTLIQSREKITNQDYLALSELVSVLLPFKEVMQQVEGENIVTSSCICPVVLGLLKAMEKLKNSNLHYCQKLAANLKDSVSKRLLPYINCPDNRLASLLDPRFKISWIEDDVEKEEAIRVLKTHVASRLGKDDEESCRWMRMKTLQKSQSYLTLTEGLKKKRPRNSINEVDSYFGVETMHFNEDPLMYWKKKSQELPTLATLDKDYLGLTATSAPSERIFPIADNFYTARRNLLGPETFRSLVFMKCNPKVFEQVKM